jgi:hypothetical protein
MPTMGGQSQKVTAEKQRSKARAACCIAVLFVTLTTNEDPRRDMGEREMSL